MDVISFQKIFGLCGLECHIVEIWRDVTLVHGQRTTEYEDRARILEAEFAIIHSGIMGQLMTISGGKRPDLGLIGASKWLVWQ